MIEIAQTQRLRDTLWNAYQAKRRAELAGDHESAGELDDYLRRESAKLLPAMTENQALRHTLLQLDDFAPDIAQVRDTVINGEFTTETGPDGFPYTGINKLQVPHWFELISAAIEAPIIPRLSFFRMNVAGELPHSWVHSDDICARYAGLLYLNPPHQCQGGTAFWWHTGLHIDSMPSLEQMTAGGGNPDWFKSMMNREWKDLTFWQQCGFVGMQFNRFILYPTARFHSRYPFEGFGTSPQDARLVWTCFLDLA